MEAKTEDPNNLFNLLRRKKHDARKDLSSSVVRQSGKGLIPGSRERKIITVRDTGNHDGLKNLQETSGLKGKKGQVGSKSTVIHSTDSSVVVHKRVDSIRKIPTIKPAAAALKRLAQLSSPSEMKFSPENSTCSPTPQNCSTVSARKKF